MKSILPATFLSVPPSSFYRQPLSSVSFFPPPPLGWVVQWKRWVLTSALPENFRLLYHFLAYPFGDISCVFIRKCVYPSSLYTSDGLRRQTPFGPFSRSGLLIFQGYLCFHTWSCSFSLDGRMPFPCVDGAWLVYPVLSWWTVKWFLATGQWVPLCAQHLSLPQCVASAPMHIPEEESLG